MEKHSTKMCCRCKEIKPVEAFGKAKDKKDGLYPACRECERIRSREGYARRPKKDLPIRERRKKVPARQLPLLADEEWRDIPGFNGIYQVSDMGRIRSSLLYGSRTRKKSGYWRILKQSINARGRPKVNLYTSVPSQAVTKEVHRVVLEAFMGPCPPGMEACHNNGDEMDNRLENLRWDTRVKNMLDMREHNSAGVLTIDEVRSIRAKFRAGIRQIDLAEMFGISRGHINNIIHGRAWKE